MPSGRGYLVPEEHVILEVEGEDSSQLRKRGRGQACITTLYNYAMPLIRYLNGDMLELATARDDRPFLRIDEVEGRVPDQLVRTDGEKVSGIIIPHLVYKSGFPAWKYQAIQKTKTKIEFHYLLDSDESLSAETKQDVTSSIRDHLGIEVEVQFIEGGFETPESGKHRFVVNQVDDTHFGGNQ